MFKRIDHVEIIPWDVEKTIDFYTRILNFKVRERVKVNAPPLAEVIYLQLGDTTVEVLSVKNPTPKNADPWAIGYRMLALEVSDMDEALKYLKGKGIEPSWGPVDLGGPKRAEIRDPDGLPIELRQW